MQNLVGWLERWDAVLAAHFPGRNREFEFVLEAIERLVGTPETLVDLACGPGSLAVRAAGRFPGAGILGVDLDPVLLEIAHAAVGSGRVRFVDGDIVDQGWAESLGEVDVVCVTAALHYLDPARLPAVASMLADRIRRDGILLIADTFRVDAPRLDQLAMDMRLDSLAAADGTETWSAWWSDVAAEPAFADLLRLREDRLGRPYQGPTAGVVEVVDVFRQAGFTEVAPLRQELDSFVIAAIR